MKPRRNGWWIYLTAMAALLCVSPPIFARDGFTLTLSGSLYLSARRVSLTPNNERIDAAGEVFVQSGEVMLRARRAAIYPRDEIFVFDDAVLNAALPLEIQLAARRFRLDLKQDALHMYEFSLTAGEKMMLPIRGAVGVCHRGTCTFQNVHAPLCPHGADGAGVSVNRLVLHPNGAMDATGLHLLLRDKSLIGFQRIHLRPLDKPGFSAPTLGFSPEAGLIAGPNGVIPVGEEAFLEGGFAVRSRQGFQTRLQLVAPRAHLRIDELFIAPDNLRRYRLSTAHVADHGFIGTEIDYLEADRRMIDEGAEHYWERAQTHTTSRVRLSGQNKLALVESTIDVIQPIKETDARITMHDLSPTVSVRAVLPDTPMGAGLFGRMGVELRRMGPLPSVTDPTYISSMPPTHTRFAVEAGLAEIRKLGPLAFSVELASRHQSWLVDTPTYNDTGLHILGGAVRLSSPLFRDFETVRHIISPYAAYRITPVAWGHTPEFAVDHFDMLRVGHGVEVGFGTTVRTAAGEVLHVDVYERIALNGLEGTLGPAYLAFRGRLGPSDFNLSFDGAWDQRNERVSILGAAVHRVSERSTVDVGARRLGPGEGPHRDQPFSISFVPWLAASIPEEAMSNLEVFQNGEVPLNETFHLFAGARGTVYPELSLNALWYGLKLRSRCGCLSASLTAAHRANTAVPDVYASLEVVGW